MDIPGDCCEVKPDILPGGQTLHILAPCLEVRAVRGHQMAERELYLRMASSRPNQLLHLKALHPAGANVEHDGHTMPFRLCVNALKLFPVDLQIRVQPRHTRPGAQLELQNPVSIVVNQAVQYQFCLVDTGIKAAGSLKPIRVFGNALIDVVVLKAVQQPMKQHRPVNVRLFHLLQQLFRRKTHASNLSGDHLHLLPVQKPHPAVPDGADFPSGAHTGQVLDNMRMAVNNHCNSPFKPRQRPFFPLSGTS